MTPTDFASSISEKNHPPNLTHDHDDGTISYTADEPTRKLRPPRRLLLPIDVPLDDVEDVEDDPKPEPSRRRQKPIVDRKRQQPVDAEDDRAQVKEPSRRRTTKTEPKPAPETSDGDTRQRKRRAKTKSEAGNWFKVYRDLFDHPLWRGCLEKRVVWIYLIGKAQYCDPPAKKNKRPIPQGRKKNIAPPKRGEVKIKHNELAEMLVVWKGASPDPDSLHSSRYVSEMLSDFERAGMIKRIGRTSKWLIIKILNYEKWQGEAPKKEAKPTRKKAAAKPKK